MVWQEGIHQIPGSHGIRDHSLALPMSVYVGDSHMAEGSISSLSRITMGSLNTSPPHGGFQTVPTTESQLILTGVDAQSIDQLALTSTFAEVPRPARGTLAPSVSESTVGVDRVPSRVLSDSSSSKGPVLSGKKRSTVPKSITPDTYLSDPRFLWPKHVQDTFQKLCSDSDFTCRIVLDNDGRYMMVSTSDPTQAQELGVDRRLDFIQPVNNVDELLLISVATLLTMVRSSMRAYAHLNTLGNTKALSAYYNTPGMPAKLQTIAMAILCQSAFDAVDFIRPRQQFRSAPKVPTQASRNTAA
ncbi:hypothetical protein M231_05801 [Tremella mesenterica]|uniref:Uncharacterized protein n=1 Tax=Tremella mesenterica TaxID=5217 RepID=A0A4V1M3I3_TREME|nr:hypothetical protein M231_05801 [Tremella mesenterica]